MKRIIIIAAIFILAFYSNSEAGRFKYGISFNYFYSSLLPYGEWIEVDYDVYVWRPYNTHYDWNPYTVGRWSYTSYGWYWDSYEPFGWATYHYGRWYFDDYLGWVWMPDYEWGPSWVEWRYGSDYIGWAPLSPYASFRYGSGIHFSVRWNTGYNHWHFVKYAHFHSAHVHNHFVHHKYKEHIFNDTKYRTNYYSNNGRIINGGVDRHIVEQRSGVKIRTRDISVTSSVDDFTKSRNDNSNKIIIHRPSEKDVKKYRDISRNKIKNERGKSSIRTENLELKSRSGNSDPVKRKEFKNNEKNSGSVRKKIEKDQNKNSNRDYKSIEKKSEPRKSQVPEIKRNNKIETEKSVPKRGSVEKKESNSNRSGNSVERAEGKKSSRKSDSSTSKKVEKRNGSTKNR